MGRSNLTRKRKLRWAYNKLRGAERGGAKSVWWV